MALIVPIATPTRSANSLWDQRLETREERTWFCASRVAPLEEVSGSDAVAFGSSGGNACRSWGNTSSILFPSASAKRYARAKLGSRLQCSKRLIMRREI